MPEDGSLSGNGGREVKSSKKARKEEGDRDEVGGTWEIAPLNKSPRIIDEHHMVEVIPSRNKKLERSEGQFQDGEPSDSAAALAVQDTAQALNQLTFKQGSPPQDLLLVCEPTSPKKRKAASSVKEDSLLVPSDSHPDTGDDQRCLTELGNGSAHHSEGNEQPEVVGDLSQYFKQIQLNKDFYEAIARTESRCGEKLQDSKVSKSHRDREGILRAVEAAKELVLNQVKELIAADLDDGSRIQMALQSYACYALSAFTKQDSESLSYEEGVTQSISQTSSVHCKTAKRATTTTTAATRNNNSESSHQSVDDQDKENIQQFDEVPSLPTADSSPACRSPPPSAHGNPATPGAKREKVQSVNDQSSEDPSRLSNDPPKRQRMGPGFLVEECPDAKASTSLLIEKQQATHSHAHSEQNNPPARVASRGSFSRQPGVEGREGREGREGTLRPTQPTEEDEWGAALVCADLTINDVASTPWPSNLDPALNAPSGKLEIDSEALKQLTVVLEARILETYGTKNSGGRVSLSSVKCLVAATAFDELLRELQNE